MKVVEIKESGFTKLTRGIPWIFANEVRKFDKAVRPGDVVVVSYQGNPIGCAFANPDSKVALRVLDRNILQIDKEWLKGRIEKAIQRRKSIENTNSLRLIHSEADGLPGLIVDLYGDNIICNFSTAGIERLKREIVEVLIDLLSPKGIYEKSDSSRLKEGLPLVEGALYGDVENKFIVQENGYSFVTHLKSGQKTGFYLDQRKNRSIVGEYGLKRMLDLFSASGGFGIYARADFTRFVESSALACQQIDLNCSRNGIDDYDIVKADVFDFLNSHDERYDLIVVDPPALARNRSAKNSAMKAWKYLMVNSLRLLQNGGYLAVFSCSAAIGFTELLDIAKSSCIIDGSELEIIELMKQDIDHPYLVSVPNSLYLTGLLLKKR